MSNGEQDHALPLPPSSSGLQVAVDVEDGMYSLIHKLHLEIIDAIDSSLSWDELTSPSVNYNLIRPIVDRYAPKQGEPDDSAYSLGGVIYALMANRIQFMSLAEQDLSYEPLQHTRAAFAEVLASTQRDDPPDAS